MPCARCSRKRVFKCVCAPHLLCPTTNQPSQRTKKGAATDQRSSISFLLLPNSVPASPCRPPLCRVQEPSNVETSHAPRARHTRLANGTTITRTMRRGPAPAAGTSTRPSESICSSEKDMPFSPLICFWERTNSTSRMDAGVDGWLLADACWPTDTTSQVTTVRRSDDLDYYLLIKPRPACCPGNEQKLKKKRTAIRAATSRYGRSVMIQRKKERNVKSVSIWICEMIVAPGRLHPLASRLGTTRSIPSS